MKKLILVLAVVLAACSSDSDALIEEVELGVKNVTLNMDVLMASETRPMMQRRATCDFPALYEHTIPSSFNVYFIPIDGSAATIEHTDVGIGKTIFEVPARKYKVIVTNHTTQNGRWELPLHSDVLYLYGESEVDFSILENVDVTVTNDYASIMVVKNKAITSVPEFAGVELFDFGTYYNIYYRNAEGLGLVAGTLQLNNYTLSSEVSVGSNEVHRFMICAEDGLNIILDSNILTQVKETIIDRN